MDQLKQPNDLSLEGNISVNWRKFVQWFDPFLTATGSDAKGAKLQASLFLHVIGDDAIEGYNTFKFQKEEEKLGQN